MAAWQSGTHGEAAGTLACTGPSIASSALRFAGRTGTLTMTSGSPTSVMAPGSQLTLLARGQEEKNHLLRPASTELLMPLNNDPGTAAKTTSALVTGKAESEGVHPVLSITGPFQTTEERVIIAPRFTPKAPLSLNQ